MSSVFKWLHELAVYKQRPTSKQMLITDDFKKGFLLKVHYSHELWLKVLFKYM